MNAEVRRDIRKGGDFISSRGSESESRVKGYKENFK